jgi:hypothetical protein
MPFSLATSLSAENKFRKNRARLAMSLALEPINLAKSLEILPLAPVNACRKI